MAANIVAERFQDAAHRPLFSEGAGGRFAVDWYKVNTSNLLAARFAQQLPKYGDPFHIQTPLLRCFEHEFEYKHGVDANGIGATTHVKVSYREPPDGLPLAQPGLAYTLMDAQLASLLLKTDIFTQFPPEPPPGSPPPTPSVPQDPIDGGKGMNVVFGEPVARVVVYPKIPERYDLLKVIKLQRDQLVNSVAMRLPAIPLYGQLPYEFKIGEVQYHAFKLDYDAGLMRVTHTLKFIIGGVPLDEYWWYKGDWTGQVIAGNTQKSKRYKKADLRTVLRAVP